MEDWQRQHINTNLHDLIDRTTCSTYMLACFRSKCILSREEFQNLEATRKNYGNMRQSKQFYEMIVTRTDSYKLLVDALLEDRQTGAVKVLFDGYKLNGIEPPIDLFASKKDKKSFFSELNCRTVIIQGKEIKISELESKIGPDTFEKLIITCFDDPVIPKILSSDSFELIPDNVPSVDQFYIQRSLRTCRSLRGDILKNKNNDIYVIENILRQELTIKSSPSLTSESSEKLDGIGDVRFILLNCPGDFEVLCQKSPNKNIHWLRYDINKFYWVKTHGCIKNLLEFVTKTQEEYSLERLVQNSNVAQRNNVCIIGVAGMGKTVLLQNLSNSIKKYDSESLVFYFSFPSIILTESFKETKNVTRENTLDILSKSVQNGISVLGKQVLQLLFVNPRQRIHIFLDALDEIPEALIKQALNFLVILKDFKETFVYVTTRPHLLDSVQSSIGCIGHDITPLNKGEQVELLKNCWPTINREEKCHDWAESCIQTINQNLLEDDITISGVPLQCKIIGEIYEQQTQHQQRNKFQSPNASKISSKYELYKKLLELRFQRTLKQGSHTKDWQIDAKNVHFLAAAETLFPKNLHLFQRMINLDYKPLLKNTDILSLDIIQQPESSNENFQFSHKSFAEYIFAELIINIVTKQINEADTEFYKFLYEIFFEVRTEKACIISYTKAEVPQHFELSSFVHADLIYFLDLQLNHQFKDTGHFPLFYEFSQKQIENITTACIRSNFRYIFEYLVLKLNSSKQANPKYALLQVAAKYSGQELINLINLRLKNLILDMPTGKMLQPTPLQIAAQRGSYDAVEAVKNFGIQENQFLIHLCIKGSAVDTTITIKDKLKILDLFCSEYIAKVLKINLEETLDDGTTAILQPNSDIQLIQRLLVKGANVNAVSTAGDTILHIFLKNGRNDGMNGENVIVPMLELLKAHKFASINSENKLGKTPLELAMKLMPISKKILDAFHLAGTDLSNLNTNKENSVFWAIRRLQNAECLSALFFAGASVNGVNSNSQNLLHVIASNGNIMALQFLENINEQEEFFKNFVNQKDFNGDTPIHISFKHSHTSQIEIQETLIKHGADLTITNNECNSPIGEGLFSHNWLYVSPERLRELETKHKIPAFCAESMAKFLLEDSKIRKLVPEEQINELFSYLFDKTRENFLLGENYDSLVLSVNNQCKCIHQLLSTQQILRFQKYFRNLSFSILRKLYKENMQTLYILDQNPSSQIKYCHSQLFKFYTCPPILKTQDNSENVFNEIILREQIISNHSFFRRYFQSLIRNPFLIFNTSPLFLTFTKETVSCIITREDAIQSTFVCLENAIIRKCSKEVVCYIKLPELIKEFFEDQMENLTDVELFNLICKHLSKNPISQEVLKIMLEGQMAFSLVFDKIDDNLRYFYILVRRLQKMNRNITVYILSHKRSLVEELNLRTLYIYEEMAKDEQDIFLTGKMDEAARSLLSNITLEMCLIFLSTILLIISCCFEGTNCNIVTKYILIILIVTFFQTTSVSPKSLAGKLEIFSMAEIQHVKNFSSFMYKLSENLCSKLLNLTNKVIKPWGFCVFCAIQAYIKNFLVTAIPILFLSLLLTLLQIFVILGPANLANMYNSNSGTTSVN